MTTTMMSLKGNQKRRCDAHCHDAEKDECKCICGGANHGQGIRFAVETTEDLIGQLTEDITVPAHQMFLPEEA